MNFVNVYKEIVRSHGRINGICIFSLISLHILFEKIVMIIVKLCCPIDKTTIIFRSMPDFSDNARALAEFMANNGYTKKYKVFFDVEDKTKYSNTNREISFISCKAKYGKYKLSSIKRLLTAGFLMSTHEMILSMKESRKGQLLVRLWHGCGYKDRSSRDGKKTQPFDFALVPGVLFVKPKAYFWNVDEQYILPMGYPRYDWLRLKDPSAQSLLEKYKKSQFTKVVLWMPTYRNDKNGKYNDNDSITQFPIMDSNEKWEEIDKLCNKKDVVLLVKLHPFQKEYGIPFDSFSNIKEIDNQTFDKADVPMYKFIALTDALISDYSSVAVDYLIVNHPIAFTLDDFEEYKRTRGFVFEDPRIYMPGHHLYKFDDLIGFLSDVSEGKDTYVELRKQMSGKAICSSDNYCKSILNKFGVVN